MVWECFLSLTFRENNLLDDENMLNLWVSFENWLHTRFPESTKLVTPFNDPSFPKDDYQAFLRSLGYQPVAQAAFGKSL